MKACPAHSWPRTVDEARAIQESLRGRVIGRDRFRSVSRIAGLDASYDQAAGLTYAAVAVVEFPDLQLAEQRGARRKTRFPYVPGYLSFREAPALLSALARLRQGPDLILRDGHGLAHPRRFGLACHVGVLSDLPAIGVAKSRLIGTHGPVPEDRGKWVPLYDGNSVIGAVVRTRVSTRPLYVSIGHRVSLETAVDLVLRCTPRYRLPEPCRRAHALASR